MRLGLDSRQARQALGAAAVSAAIQEPVWLQDRDGQRWHPIGFAWFKRGEALTLSIDRLQPIQSLRQLPVLEVRQGDQIYLYFMVERGTTLESAHMGRRDFEGFELSTPQ